MVDGEQELTKEAQMELSSFLVRLSNAVADYQIGYQKWRDQQRSPVSRALLDTNSKRIAKEAAVRRGLPCNDQSELVRLIEDFDGRPLSSVIDLGKLTQIMLVYEEVRAMPEPVHPTTGIVG